MYIEDYDMLSYDPGDDSDICSCGNNPDEWDEDCIHYEQHETEYALADDSLTDDEFWSKYGKGNK